MNSIATPHLPLSMVPSLPARSFAEIKDLAELLDGIAPGFQVDVVDGQFVPHTAWPFTEAEPKKEWEKINELPATYEYELDCMVLEPEQYLDVFAALPLKKVIIHAGSTDRYGLIIAHAKKHEYEIGIALTSDVPLGFLEPYIPELDFVQLMGIAKVGQQGQPFDERILTHAATLREQHPELPIAIDGGVNAETIPRLLEVGVNHFAPGSAISKAADPVLAYKQLHGLLRW